MKRYIIELEPGWYRAGWTNGDPPRTGVIGSARRYATEDGAYGGLAWCRRFRPFKNARIVECELKLAPVKHD